MVDNSILVRLVDQTNYVENIQLNQLVEISVSLIGPIPTEEAIGFQVFKYLDRSKHDDRQRALKLVRCEWHQA